MKSEKTVVHTSKMPKKVLPLAALGIAGTLYVASMNRRRKTAAAPYSQSMDVIEQNR